MVIPIVNLFRGITSDQGSYHQYASTKVHNLTCIVSKSRAEKEGNRVVYRRARSRRMNITLVSLCRLFGDSGVMRD